MSSVVSRMFRRSGSQTKLAAVLNSGEVNCHLEVAKNIFPALFKLLANALRFRYYLWTPFLLILSFIYYNILLLRLPSFPSIAHPMDELNKEFTTLARFADSAETPWNKFADCMRERWTSVIRDCSFIFCLTTLLITVQASAMNNSNKLTPTIGAVSCLCCLVSIALAAMMRRHVEFIQDHQRVDAARHWIAVSACNENSSFVATKVLIAAPEAWRSWAFISHVLQIGIFLVYCVPSDFRALDTLFMLETKPSSIAGDVTACGSPGQADIAAGTSSRLPILLLFVVASLHMALVAIYFTQLGYPPSDPVTQKADEDGNDESNTRLTTGTHETPSQNTSQNTLGAVSPILMRISSSRPTAKRWNDEEDDSILITVEEARDADEPQAGPVFSAYSTPLTSPV